MTNNDDYLDTFYTLEQDQSYHQYPGAAGNAATAAITSHDDNQANPRGWSAVAGMETSAVIELARTLPLSRDARADQPWCDQSDQLAQTLSHDFAEEKVATGAKGTQLWGSALMGTWTMVLDRGDATSCIVASGIGYRDGASPRQFFTQAGLGG